MTIDRSKRASPDDIGPSRPKAAGGDLGSSFSGSRVEALFREHNETLVRFLRGRLMSETDAREAAQEAYVRLLQLEEPAQPSFMRAYLFRVASNVATDFLRRRGSRLRREEAAEDYTIAQQERALIAREQLAIIQQALAELPARCQEAFRLSREEGCSSTEIGLRLGVSDRTARVYLVRSLEHIQTRLGERIVTAARKTFQTADDIQAQARDWFVRLLDHDVAADEIAAWEIWLRADPAHGAAFDRLTDLWCATGEARLPAQVSAARLGADDYDGSRSVMAWRRRPRRLKLVWSAAAGAVAAIALGLGWIVYFPAQPMDSRQIVTAGAELRKANLADGSTVTVGGRSRLDVAFNRRQRSLSLVNGEALFQVAHEPARPFVVRTPLGDVTAVGTAFDINVRSRTVTLEVSQGVVTVNPAATGGSGQGEMPLRVAAGQKLLLDPDGVRLVRLRQGEPLATAWTDGLMEYRDTPLRTVLEDVNRYAARPIVLTDASLGDLTYTGAVKLSNTLSWARGLGAAFPIVADTSDGKRITLKRKAVAAPAR